jgi:hypothetical protein
MMPKKPKGWKTLMLWGNISLRRNKKNTLRLVKGKKTMIMTSTSKWRSLISNYSPSFKTRGPCSTKSIHSSTSKL